MNTVPVQIGEDKYPVIYSIQAVMWFGDFIGVKMADLDLSEDTLTDRKGLALLYSGIVAGCEKEGKKLKVSFSEFQEIVMMDEEMMESLGTLFQKHIKITISKIAEKGKKKREPKG